MSRKSKESPLNLIRILPPKEGGPRPNTYNPASTHFKLKLDGEETSRSMLSLGGLVGFFHSILRGVGHIGTWIAQHIHKAIQFILAGFESILHGFGEGFSQIGRMGKSAGGQVMKSAKRQGGEVQTTGQQLWSEIPPGRRPMAVDSMQKERSKQREMLIDEVHALRTQLTTHQDELIRVTAQMEELKALVSSQQQVLLHLGKELEATERSESPDESSPTRTPKPRGSKPAKLVKPAKLAKPAKFPQYGKSEKSEVSESLPSTQFEFGPPHH